MDRGFIADQAEGYYLSLWVEGEPEVSFWKGLKVLPEKSLVIATYRCISCGFLESYAPR